MKSLCLDIMYLGSGNNSLDEVGLHVLLEVEVSELFITFLEVQEGRKFVIGGDNSAVGLELEVVSLDVSVDFLADFSSGHFGTSGLAEESGKFVTDTGGLDEAGRLSVTRSLLGRLG